MEIHQVTRPDKYSEIYKSQSVVFDEIINTLSVRIYEHCADTTRDNWNGQVSVDSHCRIFLTFDAGAQVCCNGEPVELQPGVFYFFPSQTRMEFPGSTDILLFLQHFRIATWSGIDLWYVLEPRPVALADYPPELARRFAAFAENPPGQMAPQVELLALTYDLLARFFRSGDFPVRPNSRLAVERISRAIHAIENNPQKVFPVPELARLCAMNREGFTREFKLLTGISPARYQMERRLWHVRRMLLDSEEKLESVARSFGFSSAYHLSGVFKRYNGISPREFRLKNRR